ncbi:amidase domain-containing protein [Halalkalibacter urbisdiaboli]|uniref:amidase domain-containing protein n=1 Tax=Halalkalibacter urbisdiaboli TaxID=1960589 RepID=UPI001FD9D1CE|nr:amidase domain-containing protein [Halalkalibacter urbisdiaboli]
MNAKMIEQIHELVKQRNASFVGHRNAFFCRQDEKACIERKQNSLEKRGAEVVKSTVRGDVIRSQNMNHTTQIDYVVQYEQLIGIKGKLYLEETAQLRRATFQDGELKDDKELIDKQSSEREVITPEPWLESRQQPLRNQSFRSGYDRREAVRYAERWWNDYNPEYKKFTDNCTNFISQCLRAGGAQMTGYPNRSKGWWYRGENWSFSWSVAHSLRWYLSGAQQGLKGEERDSAMELELGDVICYDFDGDGRFQHSTIVVAKDGNGEPLVNAQTANSRMRYWKYEDSTAWTPNIKYKFFHIVNA